MVDETRVLRLLRGVSDDLAILRSAQQDPTDRRAEPLWLRGVKYTFLTAIEACIDTAQHICASEGWGPPESNAEAMVLLGRHGVLDAALTDRMRRAVGFRNVLVHEYVKVDDNIVLAMLNDPGDLALFTQQVAQWLERS